MARPLVKTHIRGFDEDVLRGGIPQGHVVLVRGATGTMKSSLAYYVLYHNALAGSPGLYVTLEQTAAGLLEHVAGLGLKATSVSEALPILDLSRGREYLEEMVSKVGSMSENAPPRGEALLAVLKAKIFELRMKRNFRLLAIDSWDALELVLEFDDRRAETFGFFEWLRDLGVTNLLIIGGLVTFLVIWAARLALSGELPRGRPRGELSFSVEEGDRLLKAVARLVVRPSEGTTIPGVGHVVRALYETGPEFGRLFIEDARRAFLSDLTDADARQAGFRSAAELRETGANRWRWRPSDTVTVLRVRTLGATR